LRKYLIILPIFIFIFGCGRIGSESSGIKSLGSKTSAKEDFDVVLKSRYMQNSNSYIKQGHYSLLFKYSGKSRTLDGVLYENGSKYSSSKSGEAKVELDPNNNSLTNNILLLLDFSGSIITNRSYREQLKESVISFINKVVNKNNVKIAIYYFNSKRTITPIVSDPTDNIRRLIDEIKRLNDAYFDRIIQENLISTNLYGAHIEATQIACNWVGDCGSDTFSSLPTFDKDNFEFASVVVFTDGRDQAGWAEEDEMLSSIKNNKALFFQGVGVGKDVDEDLIERISTDKGIYEKELNTDSIESAFDRLAAWANSFYEARYCPADQSGSVDIQIDVIDEGQVIGVIKEDNVKIYDSEEFRCDLK
jgi:hypothetical protein